MPETASTDNAKKVDEGGQTSPDERLEEKFRQLMTWTAILAIGIVSVSTFSFLLYETIFGKPSPENWCNKVAEKHYAAIFGTPSAAAAAFLVVALFKVTSGQIEFETPLGFKFKGASGPIVLWIFCFLAIVAAFHFLWGKTP